MHGRRTVRQEGRGGTGARNGRLEPRAPVQRASFGGAAPGDGGAGRSGAERSAAGLLCNSGSWAGTAVRFEPGGTHEVELCTYAGTGRLHGFSGLLNGGVKSRPARVEAVSRALRRGFRGAGQEGDGERGTGDAAGESGSGRPGAKKNTKKGSH